MSGEEIEHIYRTGLKGGFPYPDCHWLHKQLGTTDDDLSPDLNFYFMMVSGFASTASRLEKRDREQLSNYRPHLDKTFYQTFSEHERYRSLITAQQTPALHAIMVATETVRLALLPLIDQAIRVQQAQL